MRIPLCFLYPTPLSPLPLLHLTPSPSSLYILNTPSHSRRLLPPSLPQNQTYFFTRTIPQTIEGLLSMMYQNVMLGGVGVHRQEGKVRIYGDFRMMGVMEEIRFRMGIGIAKFGYCGYDGKNSNKGITKHTIVQQIANSPQYSTIFANLQEYINQNIHITEQNNPLDNYCPERQTYEDQHIVVKMFMVNTVTNFVFRVKKDQQKGLDHEGDVTFMVLHYTQASDVEHIRQHPVFKQQINSIHTIVHLFEHPQIPLSPIFTSFLSTIPHIKHLLTSPLLKTKQTKIQDYYTLYPHLKLGSQLSEYYPKYFPDLLGKQRQFVIQEQYGKAKLVQDVFGNDRNVMVLRGNQQYVFQTQNRKGIFTTTQNKQRLLSSIHDQDTTKDTTSAITRTAIQKILQQCDPRIIFLGTASSFPNQYRNVSSILLQLDSTMLMWDCGQGTFNQFSDHFSTQTPSKLLKTQLIFISHCHSDHMLGVLQFISKRTRLKPKTKLWLVIPSNMAAWVDSYCKNVENVQCQVVFVQSLIRKEEDQRGDNSRWKGEDRRRQMGKCQMRRREAEEMRGMDFAVDLDYQKEEWKQVIENYMSKQEETKQQFLKWCKQHNIAQFLPVPVYHCPQSYGIILTHTSTLKISYSGDTRPWPLFTKHAHNSTLLIHEATFSDALAQNAKSYYHSTVSEAVEVGMKSRSWMTVLTHFSKNGFKGKDMIEIRKEDNWKKYLYAEKNTFLACDHLEFKMSEMVPLVGITKKIGRDIISLCRDGQK